MKLKPNETELIGRWEIVGLHSQIRSTAEAEARVNLVPLPDAELPALEKRAQVALFGQGGDW